MAEELEKRVIKIISKQLKMDKDKIRLDSKIEDLSQDSIQLFELVIALEKEFKKQADYEQLMQIITINDIINYIKQNNPEK